jgi:hypothetical protein
VGGDLSGQRQRLPARRHRPAPLTQLSSEQLCHLRRPVGDAHAPFPPDDARDVDALAAALFRSMEALGVSVDLGATVDEQRAKVAASSDAARALAAAGYALTQAANRALAARQSAFAWIAFFAPTGAARRTVWFLSDAARTRELAAAGYRAARGTLWSYAITVPLAIIATVLAVRAVRARTLDAGLIWAASFVLYRVARHYVQRFAARIG